MTQAALETATAPIVTADALSDEPTDADLIAAVQEAGGTESVDVAGEEAAAAERVADAAAPRPPTGKPTDAAAAGEADEPKIAAVIRAREKAFQDRQQAEDYAAQRRQQADQEAAQVLEKARARAAADYEADMAARRAKFANTPGQALRDLGLPTERLIDDVTREGTPEWRALRALEARAEAAEAKAGTVDAVKADYEAFKASLQQERAASARAAVEEQFLAVHASPEKAPYLHKRYDPEEIVAKAHAKATEWAKAGIPFAHSDVAEYLEHQARQRLAGVSSSPQQVSGGSGAPKVRANGSRTLSAAAGSERRASPKPMHDMTPDEERDALIDVAREARRTLKADTT